MFFHCRFLICSAFFGNLIQLHSAPVAMPQETAGRSTFEFVDVFVPGTDPYPAIRIPSLVTTNQGSLLAFAEGRQAGDHSDNDMILKRSTDNGRTWSKLQVLNQFDGPSLNNPQAVVLPGAVSEIPGTEPSAVRGSPGAVRAVRGSPDPVPTTNAVRGSPDPVPTNAVRGSPDPVPTTKLRPDRILLMYQRNSLGERAARPGNGPDAYTCWIQSSDDDGVTWSEPRDITSETKRETGATSIASGPGVGIILQRSERYRGRIIMPMNQGPYDDWYVYAVFSDDGGETWSMGETASNGDGPGMANEVQMVERCDGSILLNARIQNGNRCRKSAVSTDGGETWSACIDVPELVDPVCQASLLRYSWPEDDSSQYGAILFSNPATGDGRKNGGMRISRDDGQTWSDPQPIYPGGFAYSCLTRMSDGRIGVLFEKDGYKTISFTAMTPPKRAEIKNRHGSFASLHCGFSESAVYGPFSE